MIDHWTVPQASRPVFMALRATKVDESPGWMLVRFILMDRFVRLRSATQWMS
jgi:hypothetical protein